MGHSAKITTISWCPTVVDENIRVLMSTGNDCAVIFWSYDETVKQFASGRPIKFVERTKGSDKAVQQAWSKGGRFAAVGFNDGRIRIYMLKPPHLKANIDRIEELDSHVNVISSLEWAQNQSSDNPPKLLSTSFDGSARIWTFSRQKWSQIEINCITDFIEAKADPKKYPKVNDGVWINRDSWIITALVGEGSQNQIRILNAENGVLLHSLHKHTEHIQNLKPHPIYPTIFCSSGCDGLLLLWDAENGKNLSEVYFPSTVETNEPISLHDVRWSPDGMQISACDSQGHVSFLGFGGNSKFLKIPDEMFFETDYHPVVRDREGFVIDDQTGIAPHLMNPGLYTNSNNEPHLGMINNFSHTFQVNY